MEPSERVNCIRITGLRILATELVEMATSTLHCSLSSEGRLTRWFREALRMAWRLEHDREGEREREREMRGDGILVKKKEDHAWSRPP